MEKTVFRDRVTYHFSDGIAASIWGPSANEFNHSVTLQNHVSPLEEEHYYKKHQENLSCPSCTKSFLKFQQAHPYDLKKENSKRQLSKLLHKAHNHVNKKNKKPHVSYKSNLE